MTANPTQLGIWLIAFGFFASVVASLFSIAASLRVQKREVTMAQQYATKDDIDGISEDIAEVEQGLESLRHELRQDRDKEEERASKIHERINALGENLTKRVSELSGEFHGQFLRKS